MTTAPRSAIVPTWKSALVQREKTMELSLEDIDVYTAIALERTDEEQLVHEWQTEQLQRLGISETMAQVYASQVDWHQVAHLVERGCPPGLALDILR
jgi:predicted house-cleaning NTP pyrophosphatase (Maf/HAM1 superfamily)